MQIPVKTMTNESMNSGKDSVIDVPTPLFIYNSYAKTKTQRFGIFDR